MLEGLAKIAASRRVIHPPQKQPTGDELLRELIEALYEHPPLKVVGDDERVERFNRTCMKALRHLADQRRGNA